MLCEYFLTKIADIQLILNGVTYANNSIVARTDIGTVSAALLCTTTLTGCCTSGNPDTQWYFPNGSQVVNNGGLPYYRTRSIRPGAVLLHRNHQGTTTGIFRCDILDYSLVLQSIYVGIYDSNTGECRRWCTFYTVETNAHYHVFRIINSLTCICTLIVIECTHYPIAYYDVILRNTNTICRLIQATII